MIRGYGQIGGLCWRRLTFLEPLWLANGTERHGPRGAFVLNVLLYLDKYSPSVYQANGNNEQDPDYRHASSVVCRGSVLCHILTIP